MPKRSTRGSSNYGIQMYGEARIDAENIAVGDRAKIVTNTVGESVGELLGVLRHDIDNLPNDCTQVKAATGNLPSCSRGGNPKAQA